MLVNLILLVTFLALAFAEKTKGIPALSWQSVAIDASGKYHVAAAAYNNDWDQGYPVYLSDDYGVNWRQSKSSPLDWRNTYSDSTGQVLIGYAVYNSFSSSTTPPLQISKDRGNTWETGSSTSNFPFTSDIIGNSTSLYTVSGSRLYHSTDLAHSWSMITNVPSKQGTAYYANIAGVALDSAAKFIYTICDGGLCVSHNSGQTYSAYYDLLTNSVQVDSTGQYAFILSDKYLKSSTDYGYTWTTLKDYTVSGAPVVTKTFLRISNDHANVFLLEKPSASSTSTSLIRYSVNSRTSSTLFTTTSTINDVAISASGNSMIVSTTSGLFYTSNNSGYTWSTHDLS